VHSPDPGQVVVCTRCGQKNRLGDRGSDLRPICGACRSPLVVAATGSQPTNYSNSWNGGGLVWAGLLLVVIVVWAIAPDRTKARPHQRTPARSRPVQQTGLPSDSLAREATALTPVPKPIHGSTAILTKRERTAPLTLRAAPDSDFFVKLVDTQEGNTVLTAFLHRRRQLKLEVPTGSYSLKFATGTEWYGDKHLFGPDTAYNSANKVFTFVDNGFNVSGYTVTLNRVVGGNLPTSSILASEF